jgi:hypothetical protein
MNNKEVNNFQENAFNIFVFISYFLIIISSLGLSQTAPKYLDSLDYYVKIYICLFLLWRFNPLRGSYEFTNLDRKISFSAGLFIFTTTILNQYLGIFKDEFKQKILNWFKNLHF